MSAREELRGRLARAVQRLGPLAERVVLAGGCAPAAWDLSAVVGDVRPTEDIDLVVEASSLRAYHALAAQGGLKAHVDEANPAPICRHDLGDILIDLMPTDRAILGFANSWYPKAFAAAERRELAPGVAIRVITPIYFVATKLEALADRGAGDYIVSQDLEDIVTAFMGVAGLAWTLRTGREDVHEFIRSRFRELLAERAFVDAWPGCAGGDSSQQAVAFAMMGEIRSAVAPRRGPVRARVRFAGGDLEFSIPRQALMWSETHSRDAARIQAEVDRAVTTDRSSAAAMRQCWAPEPFDDRRLDYVPVTFIACECEACAGAGTEMIPCWTCEACMRGARTACPRCHRDQAAFAEPAAEARRARARTGFLLTDSLRCRIHDHDACPRRWEFSTPVAGGSIEHVAACGCACHRDAGR
jgi:hypothetical protein